MTSELESKLAEYFTEEQAEVIANILQIGKRYSEGDALAGAKLRNTGTDDYERLTELFQDAGFDYEFNNRMSVVNLASSPETHNEELNELIKEL